ncbi:MAG: DUF2155 domain-containing protein [Alphaproteobacteria bacterium]|nr:DUF2155 domain-containing protein [Alphaproteobacteria bacterium]
MSLMARILLLLPAVVGISFSSAAHADRFENGVAVFAALDKVTARISELEVPINETVEFGALKVTPRICYARPPTEQPKTTSFVEVDEVKLDGAMERIFNGWMLAESPGLNALEHPVFDLWLKGCKAPIGGVASAAATAGNAGEGEDGEAGVGAVPRPRQVSPFPRRRIRR